MTLDAGEKTTILVVVLSSIGMVFNIAEVFNYWFQRRLESKITAQATLAAYFLSSTYKVYLLMTGKSVEYFALISSIDHMVLGMMLYYEYRKRVGPKLVFSVSYGKCLVGRSCHFVLSGLMVSIYNQTDKLMLKQLTVETEIGYYAITVSLCTMWCFVLQAIIDSVYPSIMEAAKHRNKRQFIKRNKQLYSIVFYVSVIVSLFLSIFADAIISILYGKEYLPATITLRINTWLTAFSYLGVARNAWVVSMGKQRYLFRIYAISAVVNVALNYLLIPVMGASGAAIASLVSQVSTAIVIPFFTKSLKENSMMILDAIMLKGILWNRRITEEK